MSVTVTVPLSVRVSVSRRLTQLGKPSIEESFVLSIVKKCPFSSPTHSILDTHFFMNKKSEE